MKKEILRYLSETGTLVVAEEYEADGGVVGVVVHHLSLKQGVAHDRTATVSKETVRRLAEAWGLLEPASESTGGMKWEAVALKDLQVGDEIIVTKPSGEIDGLGTVTDAQDHFGRGRVRDSATGWTSATDIEHGWKITRRVAS